MSRYWECSFARNPGDNLERSPALPLLLPCPLPPPSVEQGLPSPSFHSQGSHSCSSPPLPESPPVVTSGAPLGFHQALHHRAPTYLHRLSCPPTLPPCSAHLPSVLSVLSHLSCAPTSLPWAHRPRACCPAPPHLPLALLAPISLRHSVCSHRVQPCGLSL